MFTLIIVFLVLWVFTRSFLWAIALTAILWWLDPPVAKWWNSFVGENLFMDTWFWIKDHCFYVYNWVVDNPRFVGWWYAIGMLAASYWPIKYWHNIPRYQKRGVVFWTPFYAVMGPLAILARIPA